MEHKLNSQSKGKNIHYVNQWAFRNVVLHRRLCSPKPFKKGFFSRLLKKMVGEKHYGNQNLTPKPEYSHMNTGGCPLVQERVRNIVKCLFFPCNIGSNTAAFHPNFLKICCNFQGQGNLSDLLSGRTRLSATMDFMLCND